MDIGEVRTGDYVYGRDGTPTLVLKAHDPYMPKRLYDVTFDNGEVITADSDHLWATLSRNEFEVRTTQEIRKTLHHGHLTPPCISNTGDHLPPRKITGVYRTEPALVRCLTVAAPDGLYLVGKELIPTHNTWSLLVDPLRYIHIAGFGGIIFRRNFAQVTKQGGLWDASMEIYPKDGAKPYGGKLWRWPNGNKIEFAHLQFEETKLDYQGSEIPFIGFDELQHFQESVFWYLMSRSRSTCGIAPYVRCTCQADSQSWVAKLISWYWDQETGYPIKERAGIIRYFIRKDSEIIWGDTKGDLYEKEGDWIREREQEQIDGGADPLNVKVIKSFTFIPASVFDNKILIRKDPGYISNLHAQLPIDKERLLYGNWKISPAAGDLFDRDWFEIVEQSPLGGTAVRFWDLAATIADLRDKGDGPSYTASVLLRKVKGLYYIEDAFQVRKGAAEVNELLKRTTQEDAEWAAKAKCNYKVRWEQEPGSASKRETARMKSELVHYDANGIRPQGDKYQRAVPVAVASKNGLVKVLEGDWNDMLLTHLHNQPDNPHNDLMDALSGAWVSVNKSGIFKLIKL